MNDIDEHDPLECFEIRVFTSDRLRQDGDRRAPTGYQLVEIENRDGVTNPMGVATISRCAELVAYLNPARVRIRIADCENADAIFLALGVAADGEQHQRTLH